MSLLSNAKWNSFSQVFKILIQVINLIYLAKIIPPSEYGIMAMTSVVTSLGILLRDLGTSAAIIQQKEIGENLKNTIFWLNTIMGMIIAFAICLSSSFIASVYSEPKLEYVLLMISVIFPLSSISSAHLALMERMSQFKKISLIEIISSLLSVIVAICMAKKGFGVYSLVGQAITLNLVSAIQFWCASDWRPSCRRFVDINELKKIFSFSANLSAFNFINYFARNGDSFIIGKYMSAAILGNYSLAYRIMLFPLQSLTFVASRSLYPVLSRHQDDNEKILSTYNKCVFFIVMITAPLMTGIAVLSEPLIHIVFGPQWDLTSKILCWLAPTAIIQSILSTTGSVFSAKGRTDILMRLGIVGTVLQFGSFIIGVNFNITTFAMCYLIANLINFFPVMFFLLKLISGGFLNFSINLFPVILSTLAMLTFLLCINKYFYAFNEINNLIPMLFVSFLGVIVYSIFLFLLSKNFRSFFRGSKVF